MGFSLLYEFAKRENLGAAKSKWKAATWEHWHGDNKIILLLPQTYMNLSGDSVAKCVKDNEIELEDILVIHDEVDFDLGCFKYKQGGGIYQSVESSS